MQTPRRRWGRWGCLAVVLLAGISLPFVVERVLEGVLVVRLAEELQANVEVAALRVGWTGKVGVAGLRVSDDSGFEHLYAEDARFDMGLRELFGGELRGTLDLDGVRLAARQDAEGTWSFERFESGAQDEDERDPQQEAGATPGPQSENEGLPLHFSVRLNNTSLKLETARGAWTEIVNGTLVLDSGSNSFEIDKLDLAGDLAEGRIEGLFTGIWYGEPAAAPLTAKLTYVPDQVAPLLAGFLPEGSDLRISGTQREPLEFEWRGPLERTTIEELLREIKSSGALGLGQWSIFGVDLGGRVDLASEEDGASFRGELRLDGGSLTTAGSARFFGDEPGATLSVALDAIPVDGQIGPLLARVHPIFALQKGTDAVDLTGFLQANLDLQWKGRLDGGVPVGGWDIRALAPLDVRGTLAFAELDLGESSLVRSLQNLLGAEQSSSLQLDPLEFHLDGGKLAYDKPWTWTIAGVQTRFEGGLGLDGGLELVWNIPIDETLVGMRSELKPLLGETLSVPLRGSLSAPRVEWQSAVAQLFASTSQERAQQAATAELQEILGKNGVEEGVLDSVLKGEFGVLQDVLGDKAGVGNDPAALLSEADRLWDAGKQTEAAKLYNRLRDDFPFSPTYLLNRSRVKRRRNE